MKPSIDLSSINSVRGGYWLGGYRSAVTNNFKWVDNNQFEFNYWSVGQPDAGWESYVGDWYLIDGQQYSNWHDIPWFYHLWVLCELSC